MKTLLAALVLPVLFTSCTHYYYAPNTANIPMLREKGEGQLNFSYYATDEASGGELQAAYATGKKTAVMFNLLTASSTGGLFSAPTYADAKGPSGYGSYAEAGYGYFSPIQKSKWVFESYAGFGVGGITNWYSDASKSRVKFSKFFLQPSLGWRTKAFEIGVANRFALVHLKFKENKADNLETVFQDQNSTAVILEPSLLIAFGLKNLKLRAVYTHSANMSHTWQQETTGVSLGVSIPFKIDNK